MSGIKAKYLADRMAEIRAREERRLAYYYQTLEIAYKDAGLDPFIDDLIVAVTPINRRNKRPPSDDMGLDLEAILDRHVAAWARTPNALYLARSACLSAVAVARLACGLHPYDDGLDLDLPPYPARLGQWMAERQERFFADRR